MAAVINKRDVALQAASPRTLSNDLSSFRTVGAPTNSPAIGSITISASTVGTVDITLAWTYTQGAKLAEEFIIYYAEGTTNPTTSSPVLAKVDGAARSITIPGVPIEKSYKAGIIASRVSAAGVESTAIVNAWTRTGTTANLTANINGTAASAITGHLSSTGNVHSVDLSQISGDLDDISNGSTYFRTSANQVTGAGRAYNALDSSNEYVKSLTSTKLSVVGSNPSTGWVGDSNGIRMYQSSVLKVNIPVSGSPSFTGDISGGSNIDISGSAKFNGYTNVSGSSYCVSINGSGIQDSGLYVIAKTGSGNAAVDAVGPGGADGVFGTSSTGVGVNGFATGAAGVGVAAVNSGGGTALSVTGLMTINNTTLITNLNADYVDGYHASSLAKLSGGNAFSGTQSITGGLYVTSLMECGSIRVDQTATTGAATATFPGNNKPGSTTTCKWVPFNANGTDGHIAWWASS